MGGVCANSSLVSRIGQVLTPVEFGIDTHPALAYGFGRKSTIDSSTKRAAGPHSRCFFDADLTFYCFWIIQAGQAILNRGIFHTTESDISVSLNFFNLKIRRGFAKILPIRACGTFTIFFSPQLKGIRNG